MLHQITQSSDNPVPLSNSLERIAWAVMLLACLTFCALVSLGGYGLYQFLFVSTVPMDVTVQASRGALGITGTDLREEVAQGTRDLAVGSRIRPSDVDSQGELIVRDPYRDGAFVASVNLMGVTSAVTLRAAERPRFELGTTGYQLDLNGVNGRLEILVAKDLSQFINLNLFTPEQTRLVITAPGRYRVDVRDGEIQVESDGGPVVLFPPNQRPALTITSTSLYNGASNDLRAIPPPMELLQNSDFTTAVEAPNPSLPSIPTGWGCNHSNVEPTSPRGTYNLVVKDGRNTLAMVRGEGTQSPAETICQQGLQIGEVWQDISTVSTLYLQANFYIEEQSLAGCGYLGSECPLMLRVDYLRADGTRGELVYGFYTLPDYTGTYPTTCSSCRQPHIRVQQFTWFSFDSGNILAGFTPDERPVAISRVRFYASGHQYNVKVSRVALIAE